MDFDEFKSVLEGLPEGKGASLIDFHLNQVDQERQRGISETSKRNRENEGLRKFKMAVENLGYDGESDLTDFVSSLKSTQETSKTQRTTLSSLQGELEKLRTDFGKTQTELENERKAALELKDKARKEKIRGVLTDHLKDKVYGHDFLSDGLINSGKVTLDDNEKVVFVNEDKTTVGFEDGVKTLLESRPDIVKNSQRPGGAATPTKPGGGSGPTTDQDRVSRLRQMASGGLVI